MIKKIINFILNVLLIQVMRFSFIIIASIIPIGYVLLSYIGKTEVELFALNRSEYSNVLLENQGIQYFLSVVGILSFPFVMVLLTRIFRLQRFDISKNDWRVSEENIKNFAIGLGIGATLFLITILSQLVRKGANIEVLNISGTKFAKLIFAFVACCSFILCEEIFYRSYIFSALRGKHNNIVPLVASTIVFFMMNVHRSGTTWIGGINILLIGILLGVIYTITNNIYVGSGIRACWLYMSALFIDIKLPFLSDISIFRLGNDHMYMLQSKGLLGMINCIEALVVLLVMVCIISGYRFHWVGDKRCELIKDM